MRYILVAVGAVALAMALSACPKKKAKNPTCDGDDDCKDGEKCVNKACVAEEEQPECVNDADCSGGQVCKAGKCTACVSDGECGPGGNCEAGVCERAKACTQDEECEDHEDCVDGFCKDMSSGTSDGDGCALATIYFAFDDSSVQESERDRLDGNAQCIEKSTGKNVYLFGHTDEVGTDEYNIALSERRARSAADYLSKLGVDPARLDVVGKGETELTGAGDDQDRRVEFSFH